MIKTLSPHYLTIPWMSPSSGTTPDKYILKIYVWRGYKASVPTNSNYQIENINPLGRTGNTSVDISKYLNEFILNTFTTNTTTSLNNTGFMVWVKTEVIYYINGVAQSPEFVNVNSAVKGYAYGDEGTNTTTPVNNYLATTVEQKVSKNSVYLFSFLASESVTTNISIQSENNTVNLSALASTDSNELVKACYIKVSEFSGDDYIEIYKDGILMNTLLITDEPKYEPIDIAFLNKEGTMQTVTLFRDITNKLNVERESYESANGQPINGVHQFKNYNINGRDSFSINSGFIKEDNNEIFTQLLLSEKVWQLKDNVYIPLNLGTNDIEYQTRNKQRLLNYKIDFKYSFNKINNI